jgi:hypothetical protein
MATSTPACFAYVGSLDEIPDDSTPGLLYLKAYLPIRDSLTSNTRIEKLVSPSAIFINNAAPPAAVRLMSESTTKVAVSSNTATKLAKRSAALEAIKHDFRRAWDIDNGNGRRTVVFESRNYYHFTADPEHPVLMPEAGMIELERIPDASDEDQKGTLGIAGFWATEVRSWHDRVGMLKKREELGC